MASNGSKSLFEYVAPFAISREKDLLFWDTRPSNCTEEYPIYTVNTDHWNHQATCRYVAHYDRLDLLGYRVHQMKKLF